MARRSSFFAIQSNQASPLTSELSLLSINYQRNYSPSYKVPTGRTTGSDELPFTFYSKRISVIFKGPLEGIGAAAAALYVGNMRSMGRKITDEHTRDCKCFSSGWKRCRLHKGKLKDIILLLNTGISKAMAAIDESIDKKPTFASKTAVLPLSA